MRQRNRYHCGGLRTLLQQQWIPLLLGVVLMMAVISVWQELLQEELQAGVQSSLPNVVLLGGVTTAWTLALTAYLGQRSERYLQHARKVNQQLQQEILRRQHIETELRSREMSICNLTARLELAVESGQIGIWDWDVTNDLLVWDDRMYKLYGVKPSDFSGVYEAWSSALHPDDFQLTTTAIQQAVRGEKDYSPEFRVIHPDGTIRFIQAHAVVQRDSQGQAQRMIGVNFDITERKYAEAALQQSESTLRSFFNSGTMLMGIVELYDHDILHLSDNQATANFFGTTPEAMRSRFASNMGVSQSDLQVWISAYRRAVQIQAPVHFEYIHDTPAGKRWLSAHVCQIANYSNHHPRLSYIVEDITQRKQTELALEHELMQSKLLFNVSIDGIVILDHQGDVLQMSPSFAQMLGYTVEEALKLNVADWDAQWTREELQQILKQSIELPPIFETRHRRKNSSVYDVEISYNRAEVNGEPIHFCICRDISSRKQAEIALKNSQARLAGILEIASDAIISVNQDQKITLFNQGAERIFGYSAKEILGQPLSALMPDRFAQAHRQHIYRYAEGSNNARPMAQRGAIWGRRKNGTEFPAEASISKLDLNGEVVFTTFLRDITIRQQAETASAHLAAIIASSEDAIISKSLDGIITSWNTAAEKLFGYKAAEIVGQSVKLLIPEFLLEDEAKILKRIRCGESIPSFDTQRCGKDGTIIDVSISVSPIKDSDGNTIGASKIVRDIRHRVQLEAQRQQAEAALRQSEEKFRMAIDFTYNWEYWQAPDGALIYVSPSCERITGYTAAEFIDNPNLLYAILHSDDRHLLQNHTCRDAIAADFAEYRIITKAGETRWISHICQPVFNSNKQFCGVRASNRDISDLKQIESERKQVELALQKSESRFQAFMNNSPACAWITDANGVMLYASQTYLCTFQLPTSDLIGQSVFDLYPSEVAQQFLENIQAVAHTTQILTTIETAPRQDGTIGDFLVYKFPIPNESGVILVGGVALDMTQQLRAEEALRHQKELFQVIVDHIPVMIALFNDQGRIDFINPEFERTLGWSLEEWQKRDVMVDLYPDPVYLQGVLDHMTAAMGNWRDFTTLTATKQQLETSWTNVPISRGRFLGIGQDITDRKRKEIALQRAMEASEAANLAKSMFLANMSHELRTPLNVILGFTQVMSHDSSLTLAQREDLQTIQRSGDHLLSLINDVLDLSKIEAGHCTLEESGFDLISLLHTLRTMMTERAKAKQLDLTFEIAPEVPQFVIADEQKLRQILLNLLSNAIKFTKQGNVKLQATCWKLSPKEFPDSSTSRHGDSANQSISKPYCMLQFKVVDTGFGIAETEQRSIFDAFAQAEAGRKSIGGTGLGLTISRKLLELMDGSISVESTPEVGSTFTVMVPVRPIGGVDGQIEQQESTIIGLIPGQPHRRILVVDDQDENRSLMVRLLTRLGLEVKEATNGEEAIALWQQWKPDLTWMDIRMPEMDGYEATKQIRAIEHEQASIIIALTAQASQSDRALALAAGCNDYISKPFREETVFLKMAEYLGLKYLYADTEPSRTTLSTSIASPNEGGTSTQPTHPLWPDLSTLSEDWLRNLEDAALSCDDRAVLMLAEQLPPDFIQLSVCLKKLADQFQFEQILSLLQQDVSP